LLGFTTEEGRANRTGVRRAGYGNEGVRHRQKCPQYGRGPDAEAKRDDADGSGYQAIRKTSHRAPHFNNFFLLHSLPLSLRSMGLEDS
jgi:hypothetical protein